MDISVPLVNDSADDLEWRGDGVVEFAGAVVADGSEEGDLASRRSVYIWGVNAAAGVTRFGPGDRCYLKQIEAAQRVECSE
jgi:hypothetical protein